MMLHFPLTGTTLQRYFISAVPFMLLETPVPNVNATNVIQMSQLLGSFGLSGKCSDFLLHSRK